MNRIALDIYDDMPKPMRKYISNYGWHFNKEACEYAVSLMRKKDDKKVEFKSKQEVNIFLNKFGMEVTNDIMYDGCFVYHMGFADYYGSSISDELHLAKYVKDTIDDVDASTETTFRRWVATQIGNGQPIPWSDFI